MFDTTTYGLTKDLHSGPIYRPIDDVSYEAVIEDEETPPLTRGRLIGGMVSFSLLAATGAYIFLAL